MFENLSRNQRKDLQEAVDLAHRRAQAPGRHRGDPIRYRASSTAGHSSGAGQP